MNPCDYARERHQNLVKWRNLWSILVFAFGSAVVLFLIAAVLFLIRSSFLPGALSTLGTIVGGVGIRWVVERRGDAVKEEEAAYQDVVKICSTASAKDEADKFRARFTLVRGIH
jgi:hypothetical protein